MALRKLNLTDPPAPDMPGAAWQAAMHRWSTELVSELNNYSQGRDRVSRNVYLAGTATSTVLVLEGTSTTTTTSTDPLVGVLIADLQRRGILK
jgi:hypothetical protein